MPAFFSTLRATNSGPVSMIEGSEPMDAIEMILARGFMLMDLPIRLLPMRTPAAPSTMPDELPPWWTWLMLSSSG